MNESRQIFRNTVVLTISILAERVSSIFLTLFISRVLHATGLGIYSATMAYYSLITLTARMGTTSFLVHEIAKDRSKTNRYVVHLSVMGTVAGAVVMTLSSVALPYLGLSADLTRCVYVVILALIPETLNTIQEAVFVAYQRVEFQTYTTFIMAIVNIGVSLYLLMHGYGVASLVVAFVVMRYLVTICYFFFINYYIAALHWEFQLPFALTLIQEIKVFVASSILGGLFARPEIVILSLVRDEAQVGFYSAALKLVDVGYLLIETYLTNVFPVLSRSYHLENQKSQMIQEKSIKYLLAVSLPLAVGLAVAAEPIIKLLYGPGFEAAIVVLQVLAWNLPLYCLNGVLWRILVARDQQSLNVRAQVISTCARLTGGCALISTLGYLGAAITTVASVLFHNRLLSLYVKRDGTQLHALRLCWRFALVALTMGAVILTFRALQLWALVPLAAAIYVVLILLLRAFSPDDLALFRRIWQSGMAKEGS